MPACRDVTAVEHKACVAFPGNCWLVPVGRRVRGCWPLILSGLCIIALRPYYTGANAIFRASMSRGKQVTACARKLAAVTAGFTKYRSEAQRYDVHTLPPSRWPSKPDASEPIDDPSDGACMR
jgi:hypothetical protein